jgi:murein DD-endopeptidase MepM/ murein hydrolase activator NlpD
VTPTECVRAFDLAGNPSRAGFPYHIRKRAFEKDIIRISDRFLRWKMPEFPGEGSGDAPMVQKFLRVNREVRQESFEILTRVGAETEHELYWEGAFLRLPRSSRKAGFADFRSYLYEGETIDNQVHQGIDLASVSHSPVPAANTGRIAFVGAIGIYGKTVVIDHGFGLLSTYSHLSGFEVKKGQMVSRGEIIGRTGTTGLAGGDHLHFGMLIHDTFVSPVEWWDAAWIKNNVTTKMDALR